MNDIADRRDRLRGAGAGLRMDDAHHLERPFLALRRRDLVRLEDLPPGTLDDRHLRPSPFRHVRHALSEDTVDADQHSVAGLDQVDHTRLHPRRAGATDGERQLVLGLEDRLKAFLDVVQHLEELSVEVAHGRLRHRLQHTWIHVGGAGPHEHSRFDLSQLHHAVPFCCSS